MTRAGERFGSAMRAGARRWLARAKEMLLVDPDKRGEGDAGERAAAEELARSAAELKGGMAKVAQLMAYLEGPGAAVDAGARAVLGALWDQAPGDDPQAIRRVVQEDLGAPIAELFGQWSDAPMAAASLGEVHAATSKEGAALAVKVQYPGVAEGLRSDLDSKRVLERLAGAEVGRALAPEALATLRDAVLRELDYVAERKAMERFAQRFRGDPHIVVPRTYPQLSGPRVLSAERLGGVALLNFAADAPENERAAVARTIFRFAWGGPLLHKLLNADPNPGNYLVLDGAAGRVGFLDYGCSIELDAATASSDRALWRALVTEEPDEFRAALSREGLLGRGRTLDSVTYREWERYLVAPFASDHFHWTIPYARDFAQLTSELVRSGALVLPPQAVLLWRQRLGVASVLGSIGASADYRSVLRELVRRALLLEAEERAEREE
jgi:predicted unusual protein kinase regulating ubiquinone biosynthesis (AarF/ABC1/UbiB family)